MSGIWTSEEWRAHHALLTGGRMGPLTRACSDERHEECSGRTQPGNRFCQCLVCHIQVRVIPDDQVEEQP